MDNKNRRGSRDRDRVSAGEPYEVRYLCEKFDVERNIVLDAIHACGGNRQQVENYLKERTGKGRTGFTGNDSRNAPGD